MKFAVAMVMCWGAMTSVPAFAQMKTVEQMVEAPQSFWPLGSTKYDDVPADLYVFAGEISTLKQPVVRAAVLVDLMQGPGRVFQMVEIDSIDCSTKNIEASFHLAYAGRGLIPDSAAPSTPDTKHTLLPPDAAEKMTAMLCLGIQPANATPLKTLADFRDGH